MEIYWENCSKTGKKFKIPFETIGEYGNLTYDINKVIKRWENDFSNLFSNNTSYDESFFETVKNCVKGYEDEMNVMQSMNVDVDLRSMKRDITLEEVMNAAGKAKLGKVVGIDQLPSETLKYYTILNIRLSTFFRRKSDFSRGTKWVP